METITITVPEITAVELTPNPVDAKAQYTILVTVIEKTIELSPYWYYAGDIYTGEA